MKYLYIDISGDCGQSEVAPTSEDLNSIKDADMQVFLFEDGQMKEVQQDGRTLEVDPAEMTGDADNMFHLV